MNYTEKHFRTTLVVFAILFTTGIISLIIGLTEIETYYSYIVFLVSFCILFSFMALRAFVVRCEVCDSYVLNTKVYKNAVSSQQEKEYLDMIYKEAGISIELEVEPELREFKCKCCGHITIIKFSVTNGRG
ncbi:MAG: hypothetical protein NE327_07455 [Lentisphaeraceae bacterium]|nr:hypothetical protein [Lentisphaeraceae bacterium]